MCVSETPKKTVLEPFYTGGVYRFQDTKEEHGVFAKVYYEDGECFEMISIDQFRKYFVRL